MARSTIQDFLQDYAFFLMDVGPISGIAIPIFAPLSGFSAISSPEISIEQETIVEGNWYFKNKVIKRAEVNSIVLRRGATFSNSDFWRWCITALSGNPTLTTSGSLGLNVGGDTPRRQLLLIQFLPRPPISLDPTGNTAGVGIAAISAGLALAEGGPASPAISLGMSALTLGLGRTDPGTSFALRIPAKAWMLHGCLPVRYQPSSDFDANSSAISIQELEVSVEFMEEIALAA